VRRKLFRINYNTLNSAYSPCSLHPLQFNFLLPIKKNLYIMYRLFLRLYKATILLKSAILIVRFVIAFSNANRLLRTATSSTMTITAPKNASIG
jgi:hypothetical protein